MKLLHAGPELLQADGGVPQLSKAAVQGQAQALEGNPQEVAGGVQHSQPAFQPRL